MKKLTLAAVMAALLIVGVCAESVWADIIFTGDAEGWLASINIPAITVELKTRDTTEWNQNLAGIKAIFGYYRN